MSTFNTKKITNTSGGAPTFSQGMNVAGADILSSVGVTEYYSQASAPAGAANGAIWYDGTNVYQNTGGTWRILSVTPPPVWFGERGLFSGGNATNTMDYITISTASNATDFGDLTEAKGYAAACSDNTYGLIGGGLTSIQQPTVWIDYVTIATASNATNFAQLYSSASRWGLASCSDGVYGIFAGGRNFSGYEMNIIDYVTISTPANATIFGQLTQANMYTSGCSDGTYGLFDDYNFISYITIATPGNATFFGNLTLGRNRMASCSDKTYGLWGGGQSTTDTIDYVTIATPGNATDFGNLTALRQDLGACANGIRGVFGGGQYLSDLDIIDYVTIATPGNATDFGDLTVARDGVTSCSGD